MSKKQKQGGKNRKVGRSKRKSASRAKPMSLYVRGKISFETYRNLTK